MLPDPGPRFDVARRLIESGVVAVIRLPNAEHMVQVAEALAAGGVPGVEITLTVPNALGAIEMLAQTLGDQVITGVGSVTSSEVARQAIEAGAQFVVSPIFKPEILQAAHSHGVPVMPGAFTPTEIQLAHEAGADVIKVFPADVLGMEFFRAVKAPLPHLRLMPTGGVSLENAGDWIRAGAVAVGLGSALVDSRTVAAGNFQELTRRARRLVDAVAQARQEMGASAS